MEKQIGDPARGNGHLALVERYRFVAKNIPIGKKLDPIAERMKDLARVVTCVRRCARALLLVSCFLLLERQSRGRATLSDRSFGRAEKSPPSRCSVPIKRPPPIRRCGAVTSVRFSTSAIARVVRAGRKKSGGLSMLLRSCDRKNGRVVNATDEACCPPKSHQ